jgi:poly-gamma-glutamate synthesis protein (capsule biosynthesis protein)
MIPVGSAETSEVAHNGVILERHGIRFGFLGYTFDQKNGNWRDLDQRIAMADPDAVSRDVQNLRKRADVVIVSMHNGTEYETKPNSAQRTFAHAAIDAGATAVIGHHPHVVQPTERYKDSLIFYSLGNFVFDQFQREATQHGEMVELQFCGTRIVSAQRLPVRIGVDGPDLE